MGRWLRLGLLIGLLVSGWALDMPAEAATLASLHTYHERPGQTTVRSRLSLRDRADKAWQTILFKRYQGEGLEGVYLRLVGFPGLVELAPQSPIKVLTGTGLQWQAAAQLDPQTQALPSNAAQYDFQAVMAELTGDIPLEIEVPLRGQRHATIVVPPYVVHEWRSLMSQTAD
ncbi:MAG: DUF3122 domain-containing protein [Leptolyngbya sp. SIO4C1]|nr:DUF3122 domain-containing protein [Leptolyngbya sp. SIO4C1]